jgi:hypothetical protein
MAKMFLTARENSSDKTTGNLIASSSRAGKRKKRKLEKAYPNKGQEVEKPKSSSQTNMVSLGPVVDHGDFIYTSVEPVARRRRAGYDSMAMCSA